MTDNSANRDLNPDRVESLCGPVAGMCADVEPVSAPSRFRDLYALAKHQRWVIRRVDAE
ncbi:hypothetical protein SAMN05444680_102672 [Variovorax sp. YR216]|nr:hypothetical protein SAMN05444680_102672 [Variovorax sp. YR216]